MQIFPWISFLSLIFIQIINATLSNSDVTDGNSTDVRKGRVTGRIVKLYSNVKPDPVVCEEEGFKADPIDCSVFYRCTKASKGKYTVFRFRCGPGTVFDPDTEVCNHPSNTKRSECGGKIQTLINVDNDNDIEGEELPSPISTVFSMYPSHSESKNFTELSSTSPLTDRYPYYTPTSVFSLPLSTTTERKYTENLNNLSSYQWIDQAQNNGNHLPTVQPSSEKGFPCISEGFVGDSNDCKKFYRCVSDSRGDFVRYEFSCSESTVWDENMQSCNHAWAVRTKRCGSTNFLNNNSNNNLNETQNTPFQDNSDTKDNSYQNNEDNDIYDGNVSEYGNKFNNKQQPSTNSQREPVTEKQHIVQENHVSIPKEQYIEKNERYDTTSSIYPSNNIQQNHILQTSGNHRDSNICTQSGFMADSKDCQKFYRCVDNGNGGFTKYEFSCSQQTVWDSTIEACNHAWAVKECGNKLLSETSPALSSSTGSNIMTSTSNFITEETEENDNGYINELNQEHTQATSSTILTTVSLLATTEAPKITECSSSGFFGDPHDCQKFYRCVEDNKGSFTKFDYKCGEGTLWDENIESCNHAWAVTSCDKNSSNNTSLEPPLYNPNRPTTISSIQTAANENYQNYDNDSTYNSHVSATTTTTFADNNVSKSTVNYQQSECQYTGFMGDVYNCKNFYQCVDNGNGGFTRHEFTCGEGTVWDSTIEACNHAWAVKECSTSNMQTTPNINDVSFMTSEISVHEDENITHSNVMPDNMMSSTTFRIPNDSMQSNSNQNECTTSGFIGDKKDCKKFYRCVDNGNGSFTQHEFSCGPGTAWDSKIEACNHEWAVENCGTHSEIQIEPSVQSENNTQTVITTASPITQIQQTHTPNYSLVSAGTEVSQPNFGENDCSSEGFYGNRNDCKKFFRCVNDGKGGFTKYDFICGDGTVWVQEIQSCDHDTDMSCSYTESTTSTLKYENNTSTALSVSSTMETEQETHKPNTQECVSEGFYPNKSDCRNFFRCVDSGDGRYTKYEFSCSEGTAWDVTIESCNYISKVNSCKDVPGKPIIQDEEVSDSGQVSTTEKTSTVTTSVETTSKSTTSSEITSQSTNSIATTSLSNEPQKTTLKSTTTKTTTTNSPAEHKDPVGKDFCEQDGYYGNTLDCSKFYRCVASDNGHYTKYDFSCGEGTIWDQDITACNHPQDVTNLSCKSEKEISSTSTTSSTQLTSVQNGNVLETTTTTSPVSTSSPSNKNDSNSSCVNNETSTESSSISSNPDKNITCEKAGFYANPNDCKKFYRCVDWDGSGDKFSIFHFECGDGTIWDPALETCNHIDSVYPPRNCNSTQQHNGDMAESSSTTETISSTSGDNTTTTNQPTTVQSTTQKTTSQETTTTTQVTTTQKTTTQETTIQPTTMQQTTTQKTTTQVSTTQLSSTQEPTTHQSTTQEATTTQESTTDKSTTLQTTESTQTTAQSTQGQTTKSSTEQSTSTEATESSTGSSTTEFSDQTTTTDSTTQQLSTTDNTPSTESSTTEVTGNASTTENQTESSTESNTSNNKCPHTDKDQYLFVCPTSFKRHPKYCNLFYQCTEDNESHEVKIAVFQCPNNTIYDESKIQCVEESQSKNKCEGETAKKHRVKRLGLVNNEPIIVTNDSMSCPSSGHFPFEKQEQCSPALLKCQLTKSGILRGIVYRCPEGYVYWNISRRCEPLKKVIDCKKTFETWNRRYDIPVERDNVGK